MKHYLLESNNGTFHLYSPQIGLYIIKDASLNEIKLALAEEIEYKAKLDIVKLLITFPDGYSTTDGELISYDLGVNEFDNWYKEVHQLLAFPQRYYLAIDNKIKQLYS